MVHQTGVSPITHVITSDNFVGIDSVRGRIKIIFCLGKDAKKWNS